MAAFLKLGWGTTSAPEHDVGTDLFVLVRDQLFDLGLMLGTQVKTGDSFFKEPKRDKTGETVGWWFRDDDREHVDYWLKHTLPHLLVLHDPDTETSYWVHVTEEAVVSTGKGAKILVPRSNTLAEEHLDALHTVAATVRQPTPWEGSAWSGAKTILPRDLLRYALVAPRLVAPHLNAGTAEPIGPEQTIALIVEARLHVLETFINRHPQVPDLAGMAASPEWGWRFAAALATRVRTGGIEALVACISTAATPHDRAAATVAAAAALLEQAQPEQALHLLDAALAHDDNVPVDRAWLTMQHARACLEIGRVEQAREDAVNVQRIGVGNSEDVTATAIAGVATQLVFRLADWNSKNVQEVITGLDTFSVWWRAQRVSAGATAVIDREFSVWSRDRSFTIHAEDVAHNRLLAASLMASHLGDHPAWRLIDSRNAKQEMLRVERTADPEQVCDLLDTLRVTGDHKTLDHAVRRLVTDGPAQAVTAAAARIDFTHWTHTTALSTLILLRRGGDVLDASTASAALDWLLQTLAFPGDFQERTLLGSSMDKLIDALAGVIPAATPEGQHAALEQVVSLQPQHDFFTVTSWVRVVHALPATAWTKDFAARATAGAGAHADELRLALLSVAAPLDGAAKDQLITEIREKRSLRALEALRSVAALPEDIIADLIEMFTDRVLGIASEASPNSYSERLHDFGRTLSVLNINHPAMARWEPICTLLADPLVAAKDKEGTCLVLAGSVDRLPEDVRDRLTGIVDTLIDQPRIQMEQILDKPDILGPATRLATALGRHFDVPGDLVPRLLTGPTEHRLWAALIADYLPTATAVGMLAVLAQDIQPRVRAHAAAALTRLVATGTEDPMAGTVLRRCMTDTGTLVYQAIAGALTEIPDAVSKPQDIREALTTCRSAAVRATLSSN